MNLLSINLARAIWLCPLVDLNPRGLNLYPVIVSVLGSKYRFKKLPSKPEDFDESKGVKFEMGEFKIDDEKAIIINFTIYNDGLVADARSSTDDCDAFLTDIFEQLSEYANIPSYEKILRGKNYVSQLYVSTDKSLELINPKLKEISNYLSKNTAGFENASFEVGNIAWWSDPTTKVNPISFSFERTLNTPFSENRYFSAAPLQTKNHIELLEKLEHILGS